jgi:polyferredoxin
MRWQTALADLLVAIHLGYVSYVVLGQVAIVVGSAMRKGWVRNPWFRLVHLSMIVIVVVEAWLRWPCPLTVWERRLREAAGERVEEISFIGYWLRRILFVQAQPWVFTLAYTLFSCIVVITFLAVPPRWPAGGIHRWRKQPLGNATDLETPSANAPPPSSRWH